MDPKYEKLSLIERLRDGGSDWIARSRQTPDLSVNKVWVEPEEKPADVPPPVSSGRGAATASGGLGGGPSTGRGGGKGTGKSRFRAPNDWDCVQCPNVNFARRTECNRCGAPRPIGVGEDATVHPAQRPRDPGDWYCSSCKNLNWARRTSCNQCGIKKADTVAGVRDGRGHGFMERQQDEDRVPYKPPPEETDGFDEFGRKKGKAKLTKAERAKAALERLNKSAPTGRRDRSRSRSRD